MPNESSPPPAPVTAGGSTGLFIGCALVALIADLVSKGWYFRDWDPLTRHYRSNDPYTFIHLDINTGVAWSLFSEHPEVVQIGTLILIPVLFMIYWHWFRPQARPSEHAAFGLILGGALGNAWDRTTALFNIGYGGVRDFISIDLNIIGIDYLWPTFNLADAAICCGFIWLISLSFFAPQNNNNQSPPPTSAELAEP